LCSSGLDSCEKCENGYTLEKTSVATEKKSINSHTAENGQFKCFKCG
jgi:hypothetical protein